MRRQDLLDVVELINAGADVLRVRLCLEQCGDDLAAMAPQYKETPALSGERRPGDAISGGADFIVPESCTSVKRYFCTLPDFSIYYGQFFLTRRVCRRCGFEDFVPNEKMSDVNIAVELLSDAYRDRFDTALLVSADSDLRGPVEAVLREFAGKRVVVVFPPARHSVALTQVASAYMTLGRAKLERSVFPPQVRRQDGFLLQQPTSWQ